MQVYVSLYIHADTYFVCVCEFVCLLLQYECVCMCACACVVCKLDVSGFVLCCIRHIRASPPSTKVLQIPPPSCTKSTGKSHSSLLLFVYR